MNNYPTFKAEVIADIDNRPGEWCSQRIGVFQVDNKDIENPKILGTYIRNYSYLMDTFAYAKINGRYFALYSPDYTSTRVLEIKPDIGIEDIGGEDHHPYGFCPAEFHFVYDDESDDEDPNPSFALVAGCIWGDDTSWKIQYIDIDRIEEGIITRDDRFGYIQLPEALKLKDAVSYYSDDQIHIAHVNVFDTTKHI